MARDRSGTRKEGQEKWREREGAFRGKPESASHMEEGNKAISCERGGGRTRGRGGAPPAPVFYRFTLSPLLLGGPSPLSPPPSLPPLRPCFYQLEPPFASLSPPFSPSPLRPPFPRSPLSPLRDRYNTTGNLSPLLSRHCQPFCQVRCSCYGLDVMRCFEFSFSCQLLACKVD